MHTFHVHVTVTRQEGEDWKRGRGRKKRGQRGCLVPFPNLPLPELVLEKGVVLGPLPSANVDNSCLDLDLPHSS